MKTTDLVRVDELAKGMAANAAELQNITALGTVELALANVALYCAIEIRRVAEKSLARKRTKE